MAAILKFIFTTFVFKCFLVRYNPDTGSGFHINSTLNAFLQNYTPIKCKIFKVRASSQSEIIFQLHIRNIFLLLFTRSQIIWRGDYFLISVMTRFVVTRYYFEISNYVEQHCICTIVRKIQVRLLIEIEFPRFGNLIFVERKKVKKKTNKQTNKQTNSGWIILHKSNKSMPLDCSHLAKMKRFILNMPLP